MTIHNTKSPYGSFGFFYSNGCLFETAVPIVALMKKGMSVGAVIELIIGGAGMTIPEMRMMASIFKKKLVSAIVAVIFLAAVIGGYAFWT